MARDHDRQAIPFQCLPNRPSFSLGSDLMSNPVIGPNFTIRNAIGRIPDLDLKRSSPAGIEVDLNILFAA